MSSSESSRQLSTIGKMIVPCPLTTRVPRNPYTMSASLGPAFRNILASTTRRNRRVRTINPRMIQVPIAIPNIWPPYLLDEVASDFPGSVFLLHGHDRLEGLFLVLERAV